MGSADQRSKIGTFDIAPSWTRLLNTNTVFTLGAFVRRDQYNYYPSNNAFADASPALQLTTVGQNRTLTNAGARATVSYVKGIHNIKAGVTYEQTFLNEKDNFGIVDPTDNAVCLNPDGTANTNPALTDQAQCTGALAPNTGQGVVPAFIPLLGCYDLTRTAPLPASDGCPTGQTTSGLYAFPGHTDIKEAALFAEDSLTVKNWNFNLGLRADFYNGISSARQLERRASVSLTTSRPRTPSFRVSYARTMESPFQRKPDHRQRGLQ